MSEQAPRINERGTLLVPIAPSSLGLPDEGATLTLGAFSLRQKREHHLTVFNYPIGKLLRQAAKADPELVPAIDAASAAFSWALRPRDAHVLLIDEKPGKPRVVTVIVMVDAGTALFFAEARRLVLERGEARHPALAEALLHPPPPHVTLFTNDPEGVLGIGLNREADLHAALARAESGGEGLVAYRLAPGIVQLPRVE